MSTKKLFSYFIEMGVVMANNFAKEFLKKFSDDFVLKKYTYIYQLLPLYCKIFPECGKYFSTRGEYFTIREIIDLYEYGM